MKLANIVSERELAELGTTMLGATPATPTTPGATTLTPGQQVASDPAAQQKMVAQQALDRANRKKQLQDQLKQAQEQLKQAQENVTNIQKQLAAVR